MNILFGENKAVWIQWDTLKEVFIFSIQIIFFDMKNFI